MRHLFTVHAFLAEFDIAFRAFDLYVETMTKGKARAEKSGSAGPDLDSNETALRLAADAIRLSCRYGSQEAAERALSIGATMQHWIEKGSGGFLEQGNTTSSNSQNRDSLGPITSNLSPEILTVAYLGIGVSQANVARVTYDPRLRGDMQNRAVESLRRSLQQGLPDAECTESLYVMGLVLAEMRDIAGAIEMVKRALTSLEATASANLNGDTIHDRAQADPRHMDEESFVKEKRFLPVGIYSGSSLVHERSSTWLGILAKLQSSNSRILSACLEIALNLGKAVKLHLIICRRTTRRMLRHQHEAQLTIWNMSTNKQY